MHGQQPVEHTLLRGWIAARFAAAFVFLLIALFGLLIAPQPNFVVWALAEALVAGAVVLIANSWRGQRNCVLNCHGIRWYSLRGGLLVPWNEVDSITVIGVARFHITVHGRTIRVQRSRLSDGWCVAASLAAWYGPFSSEKLDPNQRSPFDTCNP
jgi:hypothetical protein